MFLFPSEASWFGITRATKLKTAISYVPTYSVIKAIPANMHKYSLETTGALMKGYFHSSCILVARDRSCSPHHKLQHRNIWLSVRFSFLMFMCTSKETPNTVFWESETEPKLILVELQSYVMGFLLLMHIITKLIHISPGFIIIVPLKVFYLHLCKPLVRKFAMQL